MALGIDIGGVDDVDQLLSFTDGPRAAAEAAMVSLFHSPGVLWWAPDVGFDLRTLLNSFASPDQVRRQVTSQLEIGERVDSAQVSVEVLGTEMRIDVTLVLTEDDGDVQFTLTIDELGTILNADISI